MKSLLNTFIADRIKAIPSGIAFPKKYEAALYTVLTSKSLDEVAEIVGFSTGTLRVYKSEEIYKSYENDHQEAFIEEVKAYLRSKEAELGEEIEELLMDSPKESRDFSRSLVAFPELDDADSWDKKLKAKLATSIERMSYGFDDELFRYSFLKFAKEKFGSLLSDDMRRMLRNILIGKVKEDLAASLENKNSDMRIRQAIYRLNVLSIIEER